MKEVFGQVWGELGEGAGEFVADFRCGAEGVVKAGSVQV